MQAEQRIRVVIVGGGTAGCATAIALLTHGVRDAVVVEMRQRPVRRIGEAIPPAANAVLQRMGVWQDFQAQDHLPSAGSCASWGGPTLRYNDFLLQRQGKGWHLDRAAFDAMLAATVAARGGRVLRGLRLRQAEPADAGLRLQFDRDDGTTAETQTGLLIDATGIAAAAVRRIGVARNQVDCIAAISGVFALRQPDAVPTQTLLEACEYGWWYAARLPGRRMIAALAVDAAERHRFSTPDTWLRGLNATSHVTRWLDRGQADLAEGGPTTALAPSAILSRVVGNRWLAVGDAASAYDPLSAQGILKALQDGEAAGAAVAGFLGGQGPLALLAYQDDIFARFTDYLRLRRYLYRLERRWPQSSFWRNRTRHG